MHPPSAFPSSVPSLGLPSRALVSQRGASRHGLCPGVCIWWPSFCGCCPGDTTGEARGTCVPPPHGTVPSDSSWQASTLWALHRQQCPPFTIFLRKRLICMSGSVGHTWTDPWSCSLTSEAGAFSLLAPSLWTRRFFHYLGCKYCCNKHRVQISLCVFSFFVIFFFGVFFLSDKSLEVELLVHMVVLSLIF